MCGPYCTKAVAIFVVTELFAFRMLLSHTLILVCSEVTKMGYVLLGK